MERQKHGDADNAADEQYRLAAERLLQDQERFVY